MARIHILFSHATVTILMPASRAFAYVWQRGANPYLESGDLLYSPGVMPVAEAETHIAAAIQRLAYTRRQVVDHVNELAREIAQYMPARDDAAASAR